MSVSIRQAEPSDAHLVHQIMLEAFEEYRYADVPSSALNETVISVRNAIESGEEAAILFYEEEVPLGSARFKINNDILYFSRLSVTPRGRGKGIAKSMLSWLEGYAKNQGKSRLKCRVRMSVPQNIRLYESVGFKVTKEEVVTNPNGFPVMTVLMEKTI